MKWARRRFGTIGKDVAIAGDRAVEIARGAERAGEVDGDIERFRIGRGGGAQRGDGLVLPTDRQQHVAQIVQRLGIGRPEPQRALVALDRHVRLLQRRQRVAQIEQAFGIIGP
ncbi:MAG: hypothetical protein WDO24_02100 [Pseudomonadota bacterium]